MAIPRWLWLSILVAVLFGIWGALIEIPEKHFQPGFPGTLGYIVWAFTMAPCALAALRRAGWRLDRKPAAIYYGAMVGLTGAGGQLILFRVLRDGPAYLVFPIISLAPVVTILMAVILLRERTHRIATLGLLISLAAIVLLSMQQPDSTSPVRGYAWLAGAIAVLFMWGAQGYFAKSSAEAVSSESLFFYMAASALVLCPVAWWMTDRSLPVNTGLSGPYLTALIQVANSIAALLMIYAFRSGKAMVVSPTINGLFPVITIVLSLIIYQRVPDRWNAAGMVLAVTAVLLMSYGEELQAQKVAPLVTEGRAARSD